MMILKGTRYKTLPHAARRPNSMMPTRPRMGKNSLTFESVVCSQMELQRRAASFSHRRNTTCRRSTQCPLSSSSSSSNRLSASSNRLMLLTPVSSQSHRNSRTSTLGLSDIPTQFYKTRTSSCSKHSRASSYLSVAGGPRMGSVADRHSIVSVFLWDASARSVTNHKLESRWSLEYSKDPPLYWSLRSRLIEEYTESESLLEFTKKTVLVLIKTKEASIFLCLMLILPLIMMGTGVSHLGDCPRQSNLPIYLFVAGIVWITKLLQNIWHKYRHQQKCLTNEEPSSDHNDGHVFIDILMTSFLVIWFFIGQYWLITIGYPPQFEQSLENPDIWCDKTVVYCAFASIVITYFIVFAFLSVVFFLVFLTRYTIIKRVAAQ